MNEKLLIFKNKIIPMKCWSGGWGTAISLQGWEHKFDPQKAHSLGGTTMNPERD